MVAATNPAAAAPKKMLEEATGVEGDSGEDGSPAAQMAVESGADSTAAESDDGTAGLRGTRKKLDNKNGLSLVMGRTTHHKKMKKLHHEIKRGDPKKIYPLSSFSIDCKGDVCKGDTILFKQKVFKKRKGKQDTQCIGRRTIAGKVVKEKYTKKRQLHNFTIMVLWSEGVNNLPALHQLIISGHQLYRFMTWRQPWHNEAVRLEVLKEKHERGNAARCIRALRISSSGGSVYGKNTRSRRKCRAQLEGLHCRDKITGGKRRANESADYNQCRKRPKKEQNQLFSAQICTESSKPDPNSDTLTNHIVLHKDNNPSDGSTPCSEEPLSSETDKRCSEESLSCEAENNRTGGVTGSQQNCTVGHRHTQSKGKCMNSPASCMQGFHRKSNQMQLPLSSNIACHSQITATFGQNTALGSNHSPFKVGSASSSVTHMPSNYPVYCPVQPLFCPLIPGLPPLNQISNHLLLHACGAPVACLNLSLPPANGVVSYFPSDLMGSRVWPSVTFSPFNMPGRFHHPNPGAGLMPYFRFLGSNNDFPW